MRFKVFLFSVIISILGFLGFYTNSYCSDPGYLFGNDVLNGLNGSADINSLLGDTYSFESLYSPAFVVGISNAYDEINNQLYERFGWDLEDVTSKYVEVTSGDDIGFVLNALAGTTDAPALDILSGGYQVFNFVRSGGAKSLVLGIADSVTGQIEQIKGHLLNQVALDDIMAMEDAIDDAISDGEITDMSIPNQVAYGKDFQFTYTRGASTYVVTLNFNRPVVLFTSNIADSYGNYEIAICFETGSTISLSGIGIVNGNLHSIAQTTYVSANNAVHTVNGHTYMVGVLTTRNGDVGDQVYSRSVLGGSAQAALDFVGALDDAHSYTYKPTLNYQQVMALLDSLKGHWATSADMATVADVFDGGLVIPDETTGVLEWGFDDALVAELEDVIGDILDRSAVIEEELEGVIDDSLPDTPDPVPNDPNQGIAIPPDFPVSVLDSILSAFDTPFHFVEIFEPIFYVFGFFTQIYGLWLFAPVILIGALLIWSLK